MEQWEFDTIKPATASAVQIHQDAATDDYTEDFQIDAPLRGLDINSNPAFNTVKRLSVKKSPSKMNVILPAENKSEMDAYRTASTGTMFFKEGLADAAKVNSNGFNQIRPVLQRMQRDYRQDSREHEIMQRLADVWREFDEMMPQKGEELLAQIDELFSSAHSMGSCAHPNGADAPVSKARPEHGENQEPTQWSAVADLLYHRWVEGLRARWPAS